MGRSLFVLLLFFGLHAKSNDFNCTSYSSTILGKNVQYCIVRSNSENPPSLGEPVVYFMHGSNGNAKTWVKNNYEKSLDLLRQAQNLKPITFVSFDTSAYSFFTDYPVRNGSTDTSKAYETWFVSEFIPYIEKTWGVCDRRECRGIMGQSMGGFGAIKTALRFPDLFSVIAVNSPALSPFENYRNFSDWDKYLSSKPIGPIKGYIFAKTVSEIFPDENSFLSNDPTTLVERYSSSHGFPSLYFDMGGKDDFGFEDGYQLFKNALDQRHFDYTTIFEPNGHHDMWKRHAVDSILFLEKNLSP
jgi:S-formylglutathione hydrolase FrmB